MCVCVLCVLCVLCVFLTASIKRRGEVEKIKIWRAEKNKNASHNKKEERRKNENVAAGF